MGSHIINWASLAIYLGLLFSFAIYHRKKNLSGSEFILGGRKMGFIVTALAAHASDMSSWIFLGYPAAIFLNGIRYGWLAIGLIVFMGFNWLFVAKKLREKTQHFENLTLFSFFESITKDETGKIRIITAAVAVIFYTVYISAGLMGIALLLNSLFMIPYQLALLMGVAIVIPFLWVGGYISLAWTDLAQGLFLIIVIVAVPFIAILKTPSLIEQIQFSLVEFIPTSKKQAIDALFLLLSWGLGYFGQPHILTKFMGIENKGQIYKSMAVGLSWQTIALSCSTLIGLIGIFSLKNITNPEMTFTQLSSQVLPAQFMGIVLAAIVGVTITSMGAQMLIVASSIAQDFYKKSFCKEATQKQVLFVSRLSVVFIASIAFCIAFFQPTNLFNLVSYAWFGLGCAFGPLLIFSLIKPHIHRLSALIGISTGAILSGLLPLIFPGSINLVIGFFCAAAAILSSEKLLSANAKS
jgi:sodium/proline symporter